MSGERLIQPFPRPHDGPIKVDPPPLQVPSLQRLGVHTDWRRDWSHIVAGKFSASPYSGLLFYERSTGVAEFYETDGVGGISLLKHHEDWRTSWTHIVPGIFGGTGNTGLLLYDQAAGFGAFYDTDGQGGLVPLSEFDNWRSSWTHIVAGRFTPNASSGLLFYEQSTGEAEIYSTDGHGGIARLSAYTGWRTSWTHIVAGEFLNTAGFDTIIDDLFFYEGSTRYGETYQSDGKGGIGSSVDDTGQLVGFGPAGSEYGLPAATQLASGSFGGDGNANLIFYDRASGVSSLRNLADTGPQGSPDLHWLSLEEFAWPSPWDLLVTGNFWMADPDDDRLFPDGAFTDFLLYEREAGRGEFYLHEPPAPTPIQPFAGYVSLRSALPGDTVDLHVSSQVGPYSIDIYRQEAEQVHVGQVGGLPVAPTPLPIGRTAYKHGAGWPVAGRLPVPRDWPSGLYLARVAPASIRTDPLPSSEAVVDRGKNKTERLPIGATPDTPPLDIPFVVRAGQGRRARILFAISDNTYNAYNYWGGRSLYGYGRSGLHTWVGPSSSPFHAPHACHLSFLRPNAGTLDDYAVQWQRWEVPFLQWTHRQGIAVDVCTESDLHTQTGILAGYRLLVVAGHSEYWSGPMRDQVEGFVKQGGNFAIFSGNVCWWQVRFEPDGNTMACYKETFDPAYATQQMRKTTTVNWFETFLHRPETELTGVRWNSSVDFPALAEFLVDDASHWIFANTGLATGDGFGLYNDGAASVVGTETDVQQQDSPPNFHRLAHVGQPDALAATMGLFSPTNTEAEFAGVVFTAATINWALGLSQDTGWNPMDQITRNLLIRLG